MRPIRHVNPTESTIVQILSRAQHGDEQAFGELVEAFWRRLELLVRYRLGPEARRGGDLDDILQETFIEAFKLLPCFSWTRHGCLFRWLGAIAEHKVQRAVRARVRRGREVSLSQPSPSSARGRPIEVKWPLAHEASPSQQVLDDEMTERVERALACLSPDRREAVVLAYLYGMKIKEIAERMGRSPQAVALLVFRALRQLRSILNAAPACRDLERTRELTPANRS